MKFKRFLTAVFLVITSGCFAQNSIRINSRQTDRYGMEILGGWAVANIAGGSAGWAASTGEARYFYKMNVLLNIPNLGASLIGYFITDNAGNDLFLPRELLARQKKIERKYLVNAGVDVAGLGLGIYLRHRGIVTNSVKLKGYGSAGIVQSAFLLLFDGGMYGAQRHFGNKLRKFFKNNELTFDGRQIGVSLRI